jgi:hypothetical protein
VSVLLSPTYVLLLLLSWLLACNAGACSSYHSSSWPAAAAAYQRHCGHGRGSRQQV